MPKRRVPWWIKVAQLDQEFCNTVNYSNAACSRRIDVSYRFPNRVTAIISSFHAYIKTVAACRLILTTTTTTTNTRAAPVFPLGKRVVI